MKKFILFNSPIFWDTTKEKEQYLLNQQEIIKNRPKIKRME